MAEGSKAKYIREALERALDLKVPSDWTPEQFERTFALRVSPQELANITFAEVLVRQLLVKACSGNDRSITEVLDRLLGKPMQTTETVTKSYSYHDFLLTCKEADEKEIIELVPAAQRMIVVQKKPGDDAIADLLG